MKWIKMFYVFPFLMGLLFIQCKKEYATAPQQLVDFSQKTSVSYPYYTGAKSIIISNPLGLLYLYGQVDTSQINLTLDNVIKAKDSVQSQKMFQEIEPDYYFMQGNIYCSVIFPIADKDLYKTNLHVGLPPLAPVAIIYPDQNRGIYSFFLDTTLTVYTKESASKFIHHSGSLEAHSAEGNIDAEIFLPLSGFCRCYSIDGNITVKIPTETSANIILKTENGLISFAHLNVSVISQSDNELKGTIGLGGAEIYLESLNGKVVLKGF